MTLEHFALAYPERLFADFKGRSDGDLFAYVSGELAQGAISAATLDSYKREAYLGLFARVELVPGIEGFVRAARRKYGKLGLATSANRRDFGLAADRYHLRAWFDVIVTAEDTEQHKPHPAPYLKALSGLHANAADTLVVEDSPNGILAAKSAGCTVAGLTTAFAPEELRAAGADLIARSFAELQQALILPKESA
jgi:HAD superfamily hydrolase (TIGR01509 family)